MYQIASQLKRSAVAPAVSAAPPTAAPAATVPASETVDQRQHERQRATMAMLKEALQRGRLPYDRDLHQTEFPYEPELGTVKRTIVDTLDNLKSTDAQFKDALHRHRQDFREVLDIERVQGSWDMKQLPSRLIEAVKLESEGIKTKREREAQERARALAASEKELQRRAEQIHASYADRQVMHGIAAPKFTHHFSDLFGEVAHVELVHKSPLQDTIAVFTVDGMVELFSVREEAHVATAYPRPGHSNFKADSILVDFLTIPIIAKGEKITAAVKLFQYAEQIQVAREQDISPEPADGLRTGLADLQEEECEPTSDSIDGMDAMESNPIAKNTSKLSSVSVNSSPDMVSATKIRQYFFLGLSTGSHIIVEVIFVEETEDGKLTLEIGEVSRGDLWKQPITTIFWHCSQKTLFILGSEKQQGDNERFIAEYSVQGDTFQPAQRASKREDGMDRSIPVLASSSIPHLKATTAGSSGTLFNRNLNASREFQFAPRNVHLVEVARCPVEMVEKQVNATVAFWYNSLNQQRISGHRKPHPFPVYGSTKRVVLLPSFVTTIEKAAVNVGTAGSDAATAKTPFSKRRSSVASSTSATMPEETEKGRIQISGIAYDADKQVLILSVHSSLYPTLAMVVAVDKMSMPSSSAKLAALNGSVSSAPSFRFEARVLFGLTPNTENKMVALAVTAPLKSPLDEDFQLVGTPHAETEPQFRTTSLSYFTNANNGDRCVLVGCNDRSSRVVVIEANGQECCYLTDTYAAVHDPSESAVETKMMRMSKNIDMAVSYTATGKLLMYQPGFPSAFYEQHIPSSSYAAGTTCPRRQIHVFEQPKNAPFTTHLLAVVSGAEWSLVDATALHSWFEFRQGGRVVESANDLAWSQHADEVKKKRAGRMQEFQKVFVEKRGKLSGAHSVSTAKPATK